MDEMLCRVCLKTSSTMVPIFDMEDEDNQSDLSILLEECGNLKVVKNDTFSKFLCAECMSELLTASRFRDKCHKAKETYQRLIRSNEEAERRSTNDNHAEAIDNKDVIPQNMLHHPEPQADDDEQFVALNEDYRQNTNNVPEKITPSQSNAASVAFGEFSIGSKIDSGVFSCREQTDIEDNFDFDDIIVYDAEDCENDEESNIKIEKSDEDDSSLPSVSQDSERNFICDQCGAAFKQASNLLKHTEKKHIGSVNFICEMCNHCFTVAENLHAHMKDCDTKIHQPKPINPSKNNHSCTHCGKVTSSRFALDMHIRTHTNERPFLCPKANCDKAFKTQAVLQQHLKRHSGQKDFACNFCPRRFYDKHTLNDHLRWHRNDRPHVCTICNKRFTRVFLLQVHMRYHKNERPYKCEHCSKTFTQNGDLAYHKRLHLATKPFQCDLCNASFVRSGHLKTHKAAHHSVPIKPEVGSEIDEIFNLIMNQPDDKCVSLYDESADSALSEAVNSADDLINNVDLSLDFFLNDLDIQET